MSDAASPVRQPFRSSEAVFRHLKDEHGLDADGDMNAIALFAYALIEKERFEWKDHFRGVEGRDPTPEDVQHYFAQKPPEYFVKVMDDAYAWFLGFSRSLLAEEIEAEKREAVDASICTEIR